MDDKTEVMELVSICMHVCMYLISNRRCLLIRVSGEELLSQLDDIDLAKVVLRDPISRLRVSHPVHLLFSSGIRFRSLRHSRDRDGPQFRRRPIQPSAEFTKIIKRKLSQERNKQHTSYIYISFSTSLLPR